MRITNQMLNDSARRAGLPVQCTSLLDYINKQGESGNALLDALEEEKGTSGISSLKKTGYEKIEKAASAYGSETEKFTDTTQNSLFAKARESGDMETVYTGVERLLEKYNGALKAMRSGGDNLNAYYAQMFGEAALGQSALLGEIGIGIEKDGSLKLDKDTLKKADIDTIEKVLGSESAFVTRTGFVAGRAKDLASANAKSVSNQYDANGNTYTAQTSRYSFLG